MIISLSAVLTLSFSGWKKVVFSCNKERWRFLEGSDCSEVISLLGLIQHYRGFIWSQNSRCLSNRSKQPLSETSLSCCCCRVTASDMWHFDWIWHLTQWYYLAKVNHNKRIDVQYVGQIYYSFPFAVGNSTDLHWYANYTDLVLGGFFYTFQTL